MIPFSDFLGLYIPHFTPVCKCHFHTLRLESFQSGTATTSHGHDGFCRTPIPCRPVSNGENIMWLRRVNGMATSMTSPAIICEIAKNLYANHWWYARNPVTKGAATMARITKSEAEVTNLTSGWVEPAHQKVDAAGDDDHGHHIRNTVGQRPPANVPGLVPEDIVG